MNKRRLLICSFGLNLLLVAGGGGYLLSEHFHRDILSPESYFRSSDFPAGQIQVRVSQANGSPFDSHNPADGTKGPPSSRGEPRGVAQGVTVRSINSEYSAEPQKTSSYALAPSQFSSGEATSSTAVLPKASDSLQSTANLTRTAGGSAVLSGGAGSAPYTLNSHAGAPTYPIALAQPDPAISLTKQQAGVWEQLQQNFSDAVGGPNQNPSDPAYAASWNQAKDQNDQMFRAKFGNQAWLLQSTAASRQGRNP